MTDRRLLVSAAALVMASAALAGCERSPYPEPSRIGEPPPSSSAPELMGAPDSHERGAAPSADAYSPTADGLQPAPDRPGEAQSSAPAPDGYAPSSAPPPKEPPPLAPPRIIAMAPIPNPPERARLVHRELRAHAQLGSGVNGLYAARRERQAARAEHRRARVHRRFSVAAPPVARPASPSSPRRSTAPTVHAPSKAIGRTVPTPDKNRSPAPVARAPSADSARATSARGQATTAPHKVLAPKLVQVAKPAPALVTATTPTLGTPGKPQTTAVAATSSKSKHKHAVTERTPLIAPTAEGAAKLAALSGALGPVIAGRSVLKGVDGLKAGAPGDVSLSIPSDFAEALRNEAKRADLTDAAASTAIVAKLSGDGYAVSPTEAQSQPLMSGKATDFRWTVTKMDSARGPLQAEVGADLLGGGKQHLDFGAIAARAPTGFRLSPRALGIGLLLLVAILAGALLSGGRRSRAPEPTRPEIRS